MASVSYNFGQVVLKFSDLSIISIFEVWQARELVLVYFIWTSSVCYNLYYYIYYAGHIFLFISAVSMRMSKYECTGGRATEGDLTAQGAPLISGEYDIQTLSGFWMFSTKLSEDCCGL